MRTVRLSDDDYAILRELDAVARDDGEHSRHVREQLGDDWLAELCAEVPAGVGVDEDVINAMAAELDGDDELW